jgi:predicted restriction endonuclease
LVEQRCRLTGVQNVKHLRASHIKPWKDSSDAEKIDGNNGLLLSPHVDHLFDRGFISFKNNGDLLISKELSTTVLNQWSLSSIRNVGSFNNRQLQFIDFHRDVVFRAI